MNKILNILAVDDVKSNIGVLELLTEEYFEDNDMNDAYNIDEANNGQVSVEMTKQKDYDIVFMDIMMPVMDGTEALETIRNSDIEKQPIIIMVTALGDKETKLKAKKLGANAYVTKPVSDRAIKAMFDRYVEKKEDDDDFFDFDDFDDDFDDNSIDEQKNMMEDFNESHQQISATEFLDDYDDLSFILEDIEEIDDIVVEVIETLDESSLVLHTESIIMALRKYSTFLNTFLDFYELSTSMAILSNTIESTDFHKIDDKHILLIAEFIKAFLGDLSTWKEHVFIEQDAIDVFYINASSLNSCIQLRDLINKNS